MDQRETSLLEKFMASQAEHNKTVIERLAKIDRGVYGDPDNGVPGLIQRQQQDEKDISEFKEFKKKAVWVGGLVGSFFLFVFEFASDWIKALFK